MVSIERNLLRIVEHNSMSNVPIGITEGEHTGLFNLRYYIWEEENVDRNSKVHSIWNGRGNNRMATN